MTDDGTAVPDNYTGPILEVDNVTCGYSDDKQIVKNISFSIDKPEFVCIIGPNGVGKSTLIRCVNGLIKPTNGTVRIYGRDVEEYNLKELSKIMGYVPVATQEFNVMTVLDTVLVGRYSHQKWRTSGADIAVAFKALKAMEIENLASKRFNELSAGQHQKVAIARGLAQEPKILVLDEPTSNLDVRHQIYTMAFLRELSSRTGTTVVMISHDLNLASKYADKVVVLKKPGVLYGIGCPQDIISRDMIREVYSVDCEIIDDHGTPHVVLQDVLG